MKVSRFCPAGISTSSFLGAIAIALTLTGCGGGDSTTIAATPSKPAGLTYTVFTEDRVGSGYLTFDIDGGLQVDDVTYTLASQSATQCSFTSNPANPPNPACNTLAGGEGYLLCDGTSSDHFGVALFKASAVAADISELRGMTLKAYSCGATALRETGATLELLSDGGYVQYFPPGSTFNWQPTWLSQALSSTGVQYFDFRVRLVPLKVVQADKTTYFLMELAEKTNPASTDFKLPRIYSIELTTSAK